MVYGKAMWARCGAATGRELWFVMRRKSLRIGTAKSD